MYKCPVLPGDKDQTIADIEQGSFMSFALAKLQSDLGFTNSAAGNHY